MRGVISLSDGTQDTSEAAIAEIPTVTGVTPLSAPSATPAVLAAGEPKINGLLRRMVQMGASDLHLSSSHRPMIRESGDMIELSDHPVIPPDRLKQLLNPIVPNHNM